MLVSDRARSRTLLRTVVRALLLGAAALSACGGGETVAPADPPAVRLVVAGRLERGGTIAVAGFRGADSVPGPQLRLVVQPADAATVGADGTLTLRQTGALTVVATFADGRTATVVETVAAPPVLVLDLVVDGNRDVYRVALDGGDLVRLTTDPGDDAAPTAAAGRVVFSSFRNGQGDLYAVPLAGGSESRLTATPESETNPSLAADGSRLAFLRPVRGVTRVWVADGSAGGAARLTADTPENAGTPESTPAWGLGGQVAFTTTAGGQADIAFGTTATLPALPTPFAASAPAAADVEPAWSADGVRLAFVSTRVGDEAALWVAAVAGVAGGGATRLTAPGVSVSQPTWLADGRIVFVARRSAGAVLTWLDPAFLQVLHDVPLPGRLAGHPSAVR